MSAKLVIELNSLAVQQALSGLSSKLSDLLPMLTDLGLALETSTKRRLESDGGSPNGTPWQRLTSGYAEQKARTSSGGIMNKTGMLVDSISYQVDSASVQVGTNLPYAAIHQFGGTTKPHAIKPREALALRFNGGFFAKADHPGSVIPARPFLGLSADDQTEVLEIVQRYLLGI